MRLWWQQGGTWRDFGSRPRRHVLGDPIRTSRGRLPPSCHPRSPATAGAHVLPAQIVQSTTFDHILSPRLTRPSPGLPLRVGRSFPLRVALPGRCVVLRVVLHVVLQVLPGCVRFVLVHRSCTGFGHWLFFFVARLFGRFCSLSHNEVSPFEGLSVSPILPSLLSLVPFACLSTLRVGFITCRRGVDEVTKVRLVQLSPIQGTDI